MTPNTEFSVPGDYLRVDIAHGQWSLEGYTNLWVQIADVCHETGKNRILAVFGGEMQGAPPAIEVHSLASNWRNLGLPRDHKIALVDLNNATFPDTYFGSEIESLYGGNSVTFDNETDAIHWLL
jgi:hypothetical protein